MMEIGSDDARLEVRGLPWFPETSPKLWRFPKRLKDLLPPDLFEAGKQTAGVRIRLRTDSPSLSLRVVYPPFIPHPNMTQYTVQGISAYVDGKFWSAKVPPMEGGKVELSLFATSSMEMRDVCLYLPLYGPTQVLSVAVDEGASFEEPPAFALQKPVVFYGTSITQGGCASRPGLSYQAILSRMLNLDYVNMGFSGMGRCEEAMAEIVSQIDASCYVVDVGQNNTPGELAQRIPGFIEILREKRPDVPLLVTSPIFYSSELWSMTYRAKAKEKRMIIESVVRARRRDGDTLIHPLESERYMGPGTTDGSVDGGHPNDIGFQRMAAGMVGPLREILGLSHGDTR